MDLIPIDEELKAFKAHIDINNRTIFSAKFGDGKTFFLNSFKEEYSNDYEFITIYPVNYQIAENKEIFEYIKRDILIQMVVKAMIEPSYEISDSLMLSFFIMRNSYSFLEDLLKLLPNLGIADHTVSLFLTGYKSLNWAKKIYEKYNTFKEAIQGQDEERIVETFIQSFSKKPGSPYEYDLITQIIIDNIRFYRKSSGKKVVLIIEDLDRMDPAHLFRILNIFSAHIDRVYQCPYTEVGEDKNTYLASLPNKFGFDNIITVFDYNKTKSIFHHFYGQEANYEGYINKFTSYRPFYYSIDEVARKYLYKVISEECRIDKKSIRAISQHLNDQLDLLSVRDVNNILGGIDKYIKECVDTSSYKGFNTKSPLTYTIAIFKLLGLSDKDIKEYILELSPLDLLNCINVFLYIHPKTATNAFVFRGKAYLIVSYRNINNKIQIEEGPAYGGFETLTDENIVQCIEKAFEYIVK